VTAKILQFPHPLIDRVEAYAALVDQGVADDDPFVVWLRLQLTENEREQMIARLELESEIDRRRMRALETLIRLWLRESMVNE
jgi:hypothetical protein